MKPKFVERKKHYREVLVFADRRKLLEMAQDALGEAHTKFPKAFWKVMAQRCVQSVHLFEPLELAIIARAFDVHRVEVRGVDVYGAIARQALKARRYPGAAVLVLADVLSRRLTMSADAASADPALAAGATAKAELLRLLGRECSNALWELAPSHAVAVLEALALAGVRDTALCNRVARKVLAHIEVFELQDLARAARAFADHEHRDVALFGGLATRAAELVDNGGSQTSAGRAAAQRVVDSFRDLEIDNKLLGPLLEAL